MSFVTPETIQAIAHSINIPKLSQEAAKALGPDVEFRLRELIQDAQKFARHSRRSSVTTTDVNNALRMRNAEPLYGFANKDPAKYIKAVGQPDVYCLLDKELPVEQLIDAPLPRPPVEIGVSPHWLFINGVQPTTAENAPLSRPTAKRAKTATGRPAVAGKAAATAAIKTEPGTAGGEAGGTRASAVQVQPPVQHILSKETQIYFAKVVEIIKAAADAAGEGGAGASSGAAQGVQLWGELAPSQGGEAGVPEPERRLRAVLASLATDPGLHPLLPYLLKLLSDEVTARLRGPPAALHILLRVAESVLKNEKHLGLERYCHQLLPLLLTCCVAKGIGGSPSSDHWSVRDRSARLVGQVCARFGDPFYNLAPRVTKTLLRALLDPAKPLATHYGAIQGLTALGTPSVRLLLLPQLHPYMTRLQPLLYGHVTAADGTGTADANGTAPITISSGAGAMAVKEEVGAASAGTKGGARSDAWRVYDALVEAVGGAMYERVVESAASAANAASDALVAAARPKLAAVPSAASQHPRLALNALQGPGNSLHPHQAPNSAQPSTTTAAAATAAAPGSVHPQGITPAQGSHSQGAGTGEGEGVVGMEVDGDGPRQQAGREAGGAGAALGAQGEMRGPKGRTAAEVLAESWREDADVAEVVWACGELLGEAFTSRMPSARPATLML